jgi:ATP-dependent Clp protease ATP-binding subunit ClpB
MASASEAETKQMVLIRNKVGEEEIAEVVAKWTGIPVNKMLEGEKEKLLRMEEVLSKKVVGQNTALKAISNAIRRSRAGLSDPSKPVGTFLFLGPTGVGKTALCKALAEFLFDTPAAMIRIDMSEFMEKHAVSRLIGAPPGYVGYEEGGYLTEAVRRRPYSIVLLDEVEKAHHDVFNILLQLMDEGRLTDSQGRTVDFKNCIIVMTSNIGAQKIQEMTGEPYEKMKGAVMGMLTDYFRPEFINRIDETVVFHGLDRENIRAIAKIQLSEITQRLLQLGLHLEITEAALDHLANVGYDPVYGARPLRRALRQELEDKLSEAILRGDYIQGDVIKADVENQEIVFKK